MSAGLKHASIREYCESFTGSSRNGFWWYFLPEWYCGNYSRPFRAGADEWYFNVKPGLCWSADMLTPQAPESVREIPFQRRPFGFQVPVQESCANSFLLFNMIDDLQSFSMENLPASKLRAIRKADHFCEVTAPTGFSGQAIGECREVWNSLVTRTGWKHTLTDGQFSDQWREMLGKPGTTVTCCHTKLGGRIIAWLIARVFGDTAYIDTISSMTEFLHMRPNDILLYQFLSAARNSGCKRAHYSLKSTIESLERFKQSFGFQPVRCPMMTHLNPLVRESLRRFKPAILKRMTCDDTTSIAPPQPRNVPMIESRDKCDVVLTYSWVRSSYAALKNLHDHGLRVAVCDIDQAGMCRQSTYARRFFAYRNPFGDKAAFVQDLIGILHKTGAELVVPSHDETEILAEYAPLFPSQAKLPIPPHALMRLANDKSASIDFARQAGLRAPAVFSWAHPDDLRRIGAADTGRLVVKLRKGNSAKGVFYADTKEQAVILVNRLIHEFRLQPERYPIVQEYVDGEGWGVSCLYWRGERIAHFTHRRLREKTASGGTSTMREHQPNSVLEEMAFKLLDAMQWHGLAMVEFKYNPSTGQAWFIEINPRLWGSIHLAISAGVEFPYLLYLCAVKGPAAAKEYNASRPVKYPWRARWYLGECIAAIGRFRSGQIREGIQALLPGKTDTYDDIDPKDPMAFIGEILHYGGGLIKHRRLNPYERGMLG